MLVGGTTAENVDYSEVINQWLPIVLAFVLGLSFILLTLVFRSVVLSATAVILNLLSVGAAYGLLVLVFQKGVGAEPARIPTGGARRGLGPGVPVLGALRPLDGLPRLPAQPDQGALRTDRRHNEAVVTESPRPAGSSPAPR